MMSRARRPNFVSAYRRARHAVVRGAFLLWSYQTLAVVLLIALAAANLAFLFVSTPQLPARAAVNSFTEDFSTTTYRDAVNTTGIWYGTGAAHMGPGNVSSTNFDIINPLGGLAHTNVQDMSCSSATTCYALHDTNYPGPQVLKTTDGGTHWSQVYGGDLSYDDVTQNVGNDIVAVLGTDTVYVVARDGVAQLNVLKTTDGGTTWVKQTNGLPASGFLYSITCSTSTLCAAAGHDGVSISVWYTSDGGSTWTQAEDVPADIIDANDITAYNDGASTTWRMVGDDGYVYVSAATTTPQSWTAETSGTALDLYDVHMADYSNIYLVGDDGSEISPVIRFSNNAGGSYAGQTPATSYAIYAMDCDSTTTSTCWTAGGRGAGWASDITKTTDGGSTWTLIDDNGYDNAPYYTIDALSTSIAYAAGTGITIGGDLVKTSTSTHFTPLYSSGFCVPDTPACAASAERTAKDMVVASADGQTVYAVGDNGGTGYVHKSTDGGTTWAATGDDNPGRINRIDCWTVNDCFGGGIFGAYFITSDGGNNWGVYSTTTSHFNHVDMVGALAGWAAIDDVSVARTINGGVDWLTANTGLPSSLTGYDIVAVSTTTAYLVGYDSNDTTGKLYVTTDSGSSWTLKASKAGEPFYRLTFLPDFSIGWTLSSGGSLFRSTDGGANWTEIYDDTNFSGFSANSGLLFVNEDVGVISHDTCGGAIEITLNGGESWGRRSVNCADGDIVAVQNKLLISSTAFAGRFGMMYAMDIPNAATSGLRSTTIDNVAGDVQCAGITPTQTLNGGTVAYEMSNDGGATWTASGGSCAGIADTHEFAFASSGSDLRWRATLSSASPSPTIDEIDINYVTNTVPATPTNSSPANGATNVLLTPTLSASAFSDPDGGDTHDSSRWEVTSASGNYTSPTYATTSSINLTSITVPSNTLAANSTYYWHVKYVDNNGGNSAFSSETSFTTVAAATTGGSAAASVRPSSPVAGTGTAEEDAWNAIRWTFKDTANNEQGFSIVDAANAARVYASTNPIFTQDATFLREKGLTPATQQCSRAAVAFNDVGNSIITASSTYGCVWTHAAPPLPLTFVTSTASTVTFGGIDTGDGNPGAVQYAIKETGSGRWLAPGSAAAFAAADVVAAAEQTYVLSDQPIRQTAKQWGTVITVVGLNPSTTYTFQTFAYNPPGQETAGQTAEGKPAVASGGTQQAKIQLQIAKSVAVNPLGGALADVGTAMTTAAALFLLHVLVGIAALAWLHREHGLRALRTARLLRHPSATFSALWNGSADAPAYTTHRSIHHYAQTTFAAALVALAVKGVTVGALVLLPAATFGATAFDGDGKAVVAGDTLTYQIRVENKGPVPATDLVVRDVLPAHTSFVAGTLAVDGIKQSDADDNDAAAYRVGANEVSVRRSSLAVNAATVLTFTVRVEQPKQPAQGPVLGIIENTGCVMAKELEARICSNATKNPIGTRLSPPVNQNANVPVIANQNVPVNRNLNRNVPINQNANRPPAVSDNVNANLPAPPSVPETSEVPPPSQPPTEGRSTLLLNDESPAEEALINDATPEISGRAAPGSLVAILVDGVLEGIAVADADGHYRYLLSEALADGTHQIIISVDGTVVDGARFTVDTAAPAAVQDLAIVINRVDLAVSIRAALTGQTTAGQDATIQVSGRTGPDTALVRIRVESDPIEVSFVPPSPSWTREITGRFDPGEHTVTAYAYDAAGNTSASASKTFYVPEPEALATPLAFLDDPQIEAAAAISAPIIVGLAVANVAVAAGIPTLFNFLGLLLTQPALLFARREKKGYGTVFNSLSKLPIDLAIVRVRDRNSNRVLQTKVTDRLGRYALFLKAGTYALEVTKQGFLHPTQVLAGKTDDVAYTDILSSPVLETPESLRLAKNIPLDPQADQKTPGAIRRATVLRKLQYAFALSGPVLSLLTLLITPTLLVLGLALLQIAVFALFRRLAYKKPPKSFGVVRDEETGKPVQNAVVRIFEMTYNKLLETQVTDARGRYAFLVGQSRYYVTVAAPAYATVTTPPVDFSSVDKGGLVTRDVTLRRGVPPSPATG